MIPCGCWDRNHCQKAIIGTATATVTERKGDDDGARGQRRNETDRRSDRDVDKEGRRRSQRDGDGARRSERERRSEMERRSEVEWGVRVCESESERDWEWEGMRKCLFWKFWVLRETVWVLSAICCRTGGGPKRNQVQRTWFQLTKTKFVELGFYT